MWCVALSVAPNLLVFFWWSSWNEEWLFSFQHTAHNSCSTLRWWYYTTFIVTISHLKIELILQNYKKAGCICKSALADHPEAGCSCSRVIINSCSWQNSTKPPFLRYGCQGGSGKTTCSLHCRSTKLNQYKEPLPKASSWQRPTHRNCALPEHTWRKWPKSIQ